MHFPDDMSKEFWLTGCLTFLLGSSAGLKLPYHGHLGNFYFYFGFSLFTWYLWQLLLPKGQTSQETGQNILWYSKAGVCMYIYHICVCWYECRCLICSNFTVPHPYDFIWPMYLLIFPSFHPRCLTSSPTSGIDHLSLLLGKTLDLESMGKHLTFLSCFVWCYLRGIQSLVPLRDSVMSWWMPMLCSEGHTGLEAMEQLQE